MSTQIDLGPVLSVPKGDWNADTIYERLNMVRHNSAAWICNVATSKGVEPTEDSTDWYLQVKDTSSVTSVNGMKGDVVIELTETETPPANDNSNRIATTEWVTDKLGDVDLSGIKDDTVLAAQLASNLEASKDTLSYAELIDYIAKVERNVGMPMGVPIPYTGKDVPAGFLRADGATYTSMQGAFPEFYEWVVNSGLTVPLADYALIEGSCGYYGIDETTGSVRMPTLAAGVFGTVAAGQYGQAVQAGLPGFDGTYRISSTSVPMHSGTGIGSGCVTPVTGQTSSYYNTSSSNGQRAIGFDIDASLSNPIYGNSDTVTPSHVKYPWIIVVYNAAVPPSVAQAGEFVRLLDGKMDRESVKAYIVETWREGSQWYNVYSNGFIEQGGIATGGTTTAGATISLPLEFTSAEYNLQAHPNIAFPISNDASIWVKIGGKTPNSFKAASGYTGASNTAFLPYSFSWVAKGY